MPTFLLLFKTFNPDTNMVQRARNVRLPQRVFYCCQSLSCRDKLTTDWGPSYGMYVYVLVTVSRLSALTLALMVSINSKRTR